VGPLYANLLDRGQSSTRAKQDKAAFSDIWGVNHGLLSLFMKKTGYGVQSRVITALIRASVESA